MQDRFKFKHWDKQINKMRYGDIQLGNDGKPFVIVDSIENPIEDIEDVITLQCTGLKDKNGKLIYENDIVQRKGELLIVRYQEEQACFAPQHFYLENDKIVYCGREWFDDYNSVEHCFYTSSVYEIIGNIYMDSHLLDISNNYS